jgi:hypothetical protein
MYYYPEFSFNANSSSEQFWFLLTTYGWCCQETTSDYCIQREGLCTSDRSVYRSDYGGYFSPQDNGIECIGLGQGKVCRLGLSFAQSAPANSITFGPVTNQIRKNVINAPLVDLTSGLVAYWSFDNCDATDDSGNGHDGTIYGNPQCVEGEKGKAFSFDGVDGYIEAPKPNITTDSSFTISFWMKYEWQPHRIWILYFGYHDQYPCGSDNNGFTTLINVNTEWWLSTGVTQFGFFCGDQNQFNIANIQGQWMHVSTVYDKQNSVLKSYINGSLVDSDNTFSPRISDYPFYIAKASPPYATVYGDSNFKGNIDEVRIYNRALSEAEIQALYEGADWTVNPLNGHLYKLIDCGTWSDCENAAVAEGAHLVTINSQDEQDWLVQTFGGSTLYWIGFTDEATEGNWQWISGEQVSYTNWADGEPNNDWSCGEAYAVMNWYTPGKWNDLGYCSPEWTSVTKAIIEKSGTPPPPASGNLEVSPSSHDFEDTAAHTCSTPQQFTISNTGDADLTVSNIALTDTENFQLSNALPCEKTLTPGDSCSFDVYFCPTNTGNFSSALRITSDDPDNPNFDVPLTGSALCDPPNTVYANSDKAYGLYEGFTEIKERADNTIVDIDIQGTDIFPITGGTINFWTTIDEVTYDSAAVTSCEPNPDDAVGGGYAEKGIFAPGTHASYRANFCKPGTITFKLGIANPKAIVYTMADIFLTGFGVPVTEIDTFVNDISNPDEFPSLNSAMINLKDAMDAVSERKIRVAMRELSNAGRDLRTLARDNNQLIKLQLELAKFGIDIGIPKLILGTFSFATKVVKIFTDIIVFSVQTGFNTKTIQITVIAN